MRLKLCQDPKICDNFAGMNLDNMKSKICMSLIGAVTVCSVSAAEGWKVADYKGNRQCAVSYTFDDGMAEHRTFVFPLLEELGIKGTFWIIGKNVGTGQDDPQRYWMNWQEVEEMAAAGHEMSNHSWSHPNLTELTSGALAEEIWRNDSVIEAHTGKRPVSFCYPYNAHNEEVRAAAMRGRVGSRLYEKAVGQDVSKCSLEELNLWLDGLVAAGQWGVTMTHGIHYGYDFFEDPQVLVEHLRHAADMSDRVWIDTFSAVGAYVAERDNIKLSVESDGTSGIVVIPELGLDPAVFDVALTMIVPTWVNVLSVHQDGKELKLYASVDGASCFDFDPRGGAVSIRL